MKKKIQQIIFLLGDNCRLLYKLVFLFLVASIFDLIGVSLIGPYISIMSDQDVPLKGNNEFFSLAQDIRLENYLVLLSLGLVATFLAKTCISLWVNKKILEFSSNQEVRIRANLFSSYQRMPYLEFMAANSSSYLYSIQTLASQFSTNILMPALKMVSESIVVISLLILLGLVNIYALTLMLALLITFIVGYDLVTRKIVQESGKLAILSNTNALQSAKEGILGLKEIRILGKESFFYNRMLSKSIEYVTNQNRATLLANAPRYMLELILVVFVVILVLSTSYFQSDLKLLLPTLAIFGFAAMRLMPAAYSLSYGVSQIRHGSNCIDILYEQLNKPAEIKTSILSDDHCQLFQSIELKNVSFRYSDETDLVLEDVSLKISKGEAVGIIGTSGSGKSTTVDLLLGLLKPNLGEVLYNGVPIDQNLLCWNRQVAYLPQQAFLLDDSLVSNITLDEYFGSYENRQFIESINKSRLSEVVESMPDGCRTILGESGIRLSGGQRQRVAIARALYHSRDVIIMDESTSSLDVITENEILDEINSLKRDKTIIVIAHNLSTLKNCDRILSVANKKITSIPLAQKMED